MSVPTSTNSPRSGPTSDKGADGLTEFDGAAEILRAWGAGLRPDPDLSVSEWADRHRMLSSRASAEPGRYRTQRTPYMREIMDRLSPHDPTQRIVFMKAAQVGATEAGNNWIGFAIHQAPGPMLAVQPTVELAKRNSRQRIDSLIEESPDLRERVKPARSRDAGNTMLSKEFAGGILIMTGANSAVGLRSTPARYIFLDEVDAYPASADEEGDPVTLAEARSLTFAHRRKVFLVSTPTIRGLSRIEREFKASDQRRYFVPCPHCGHRQWLKLERLRWEKGKPETAEYYCEVCETPIPKHHKTAMLAAGAWRPNADPHIGRDAVYVTDGDAPRLVRIIARRDDAITDFGDARLWSEAIRIDLRVREVPNPRPASISAISLRSRSSIASVYFRHAATRARLVSIAPGSWAG